MSLVKYISEGCGCQMNNEEEFESLEEVSLSTAVPPTNEPINLSKNKKKSEYVIRKEVDYK
jgi:hypothetical protein